LAPVVLATSNAAAKFASALVGIRITALVILIYLLMNEKALIANNQKDVLLEKIVADFQALNANLVVVKGVQPSAQAPFANSLNFAIAQTLDDTPKISVLFTPPNSEAMASTSLLQIA